MIGGFAIAATVISAVICLLCGIAAYSLAHDNNGGDYGNAIGLAMSVMLTLASVVSGLFAVIGAVVLAIGGGS